MGYAGDPDADDSLCERLSQIGNLGDRTAPGAKAATVPGQHLGTAPPPCLHCAGHLRAVADHVLCCADAVPADPCGFLGRHSSAPGYRFEDAGDRRPSSKGVADAAPFQNSAEQWVGLDRCSCRPGTQVMHRVWRDRCHVAGGPRALLDELVRAVDRVAGARRDRGGTLLARNAKDRR